MKKITRLIAASLLLAVSFAPVLADGDDYVKDEYGLISYDDEYTLNEQAREISEQYNVSVYIRVEPDNGGCSSIKSYAEELFYEENLDNDMVMLLITMETREYDIIAHGDTCNAAFTDYGKNEIAQDFLPDLSNGNYERAFETFIDDCGYYLNAYQNADPIDTWIPDPEPDPDPNYDPSADLATKAAGSLGGGSLLSFIICMFIKGKNKTSAIATTAGNYVVDHGIDITHCQDIYLYSTQTVTRINRDDDNNHGGGGGHFGGTSINSGGFSHSSGHF